jgi:copper chaperone CopZ
MSAYDPHYDRAAAAAVLARLAAPGLFGPTGVLAAATLGPPRRIGFTAAAMTPEPGSHLTLSQRLYLERFMQPCRPEQVVSATTRVGWTDSDGIPNTGHIMADGLGAVVPIAVRETVLALWRALAANRGFAEAALDLSDGDFDVLAATTTDQEPTEIVRIGIEATGRALAQHALLASRVGIDSPAEFARAMRRSGLFATVAGSWYWELQASTYRRGMVPVTLERCGDGKLRYPASTAATLGQMKQRTIAEARRTMLRATTEEGLTPAEAVAKYHTDLDLIAKQYALLDPDTQPRCLALMPNVVDGVRVTVLPMVVDAFVDAFVRILELVTVSESAPADPVADGAGALGAGPHRFHVPDMNCRHCRLTISAVLESHGVEVVDISLVSKRVVAQFDTVARRERAFAALRDSGYTVVA